MKKRPTRRVRNAALAGMIVAIPFLTAACQIPVGPCTINVLEASGNSVTCFGIINIPLG